MSIATHIEMHLGPIARGWASSSKPGELRACLFNNQPSEGSATIATLGLSRHVLEMKTGRQVRQELIFAHHGLVDAEDNAGLLLYVAESVVTSHRALLRGEIVALGAPVIKGGVARSLYVSAPVIFPDQLATFDGSVPSTVFAWLFPVCPPEVAYIERFGWSQFEDLVEQSDPDLLNWSRDSML